jgi:hypothetical protein
LIKGYVALLDVLGFTALVGSDEKGEAIAKYLDALNAATEGTGVDFVVFSDSIILTLPDETPEGLLIIACACSRLMYRLLTHRIPIRGAIAHGSYQRKKLKHGTFVAGKAVIEAYKLEQEQDWIGVALAPSALNKVQNIGALTTITNSNYKPVIDEFMRNFNWATAIQYSNGIPFHWNSELEIKQIDGYAITPTSTAQSPNEVVEIYDAILAHIHWMKLLSPNPDAQKKYTNTTGFINYCRTRWRNFSINYNA